MNFFVARGRYNLARLGGRPKTSDTMLLLEIYYPEARYAENVFGGGTNNLETMYLNAYCKDRMGWRHGGGMNFLRKDGSVDSTRIGVTGYGENIIWYYPLPGAGFSFWKDGQQN